MQQRLPSLYQQPILFAHRGASAHAAENTAGSFRLAIRLGASGLETDCWVTKDQIVVLDHDGVVRGNFRSGFRTKKIKSVIASDLDSSIINFEDFLEISSPSTPLSIDVGDADAMPIIDRAVRKADQSQRIYICHPDLDLLARWKLNYPRFQYVNSIRLSKIQEGLERRCANLANNGIDVLNMHHTDWNGGLVALAHRFNLGAFSWDLQHTEQIRTALLMGVDAVYSDWPDRMIDASRQVFNSE